MGSGKTTLGRLLAAGLGCPFIDLDAEVERRSGNSIRALIAEKGEAEFRRTELAVLRETASLAHTPRVVATGGGIVETPGASLLLRRFTSVVWLSADPQRCVERLGDEAASRPLLDDAAEWQRRWRRRQPLYDALADVRIDTGGLDAHGSLEALRRWLADHEH